MRTIKNLFALLVGVMALTFTSCKTDDPVMFGKPVLNTDFTVTVTGNNVALNCTNTAVASVLWELNNGVQKTNKSETVYLPLAGKYSVVLNVSNGGDYISSDTVHFTIATTDSEYYNKGIWKALTGGSGVTKTWILDVNKKFFHKPIDFYGDATAGLSSEGKSWGPWGGFDITDAEVGSISFNALTGMATFNLDGVNKTGAYTFNVYDRPADIISPAMTGQTLWENMLLGKYSYLGKLSTQMGDLKMASGVRFPLDLTRMKNIDSKTLLSSAVYPCEFLTSDLENVTIINITDSSLVVRVKRTYEGDKENKCWLLYNFIVKEYTYVPESFTYTEPIKTAFTAADLVGTWKYDAIAQDWIGWDAVGTKGTIIDSKLLNDWSSGDVMKTTLAGWGADITVFATTTTNTYVFNANGSCTLNGIANTYSVSKGVITFGTPLSTEFSLVWATFTGTQLKVASPKIGSALNGIWVCQKNGDKNEYSAFHLAKQ